MKNLAIFGLAAASASMAAVSTGSLWNMGMDAASGLSYQIQVPEAVACDKTTGDYGAACFENTGGWWFAYVGDTKDGQKMSFDPIGTNPDGTYKLITTSEDDGSILPNGNLVEGVGLVVTMSAAGGAAETPAIAGIGWNWTKAETGIDVASKGGLCFDYSWTGSEALQVELGQGAAGDEASGYNTWYTTMAPGTGATANLTWDKFKVETGWGSPWTIEEVTSKMVAVKIRIKNGSSAEVKGTLTINGVGWAGECSGGGPVGPAAINSAAVASSAKAVVSGRTLSISGVNSSATYEIVSLQGQVVKSGVVASSISLSDLNAGVYMVRVAGKSVNMNQKILVK